MNDLRKAAGFMALYIETFEKMTRDDVWLNGKTSIG
jgi:hypothetical protein